MVSRHARGGVIRGALVIIELQYSSTERRRNLDESAVTRHRKHGAMQASCRVKGVSREGHEGVQHAVVGVA